MQDAKKVCSEILKLADIKINGSRPWDLKVNDERVYEKVLSHGSLGLGEAYMDGWWDVKSLDEFFYHLLSADLQKKAISHLSIGTMSSLALKVVISRLFNTQSISKSKDVAELHYNLGNSFYEKMLDPEYMQYTCGYWKNAKNLQQAQINKLDLVCKKLNLTKNSRNKEKILELGSGFGGFGKFSTKNYSCEVTSYNISKEQIAFARKQTKDLPVKTIEADYRTAQNPKNKEAFDKIVSIGMMEHVGPRNYKSFMELANYCLKDKGLFVVHTIGRNTVLAPGLGDPWISKYIFPGGHLPAVSQITAAAEGYFRVEDVQNFGHYYDKTLMAWFENFDRAWPQFKEEYGERFYRMWKYYLLSCAGAFRAGTICLFQVVLSKGNIGKTYEGAR